MKKLLLLLIPALAFAATEPINVNTPDGKVKQTSSGVGAVGKPFDFTNVFVTGIGGGAPVDAKYVTTTANGTLTNEFNLGALTTGILRQTVSGGIATPLITQMSYTVNVKDPPYNATGNGVTDDSAAINSAI